MVRQNASLEKMYGFIYQGCTECMLVDKTPSLPLVVNSMESILALVSHAPKFISLYRHPLSVIESCLKTIKGVLLSEFVKFYSSKTFYPKHYKEFRDARRHSVFRFWEVIWLRSNPRVYLNK